MAAEYSTVRVNDVLFKNTFMFPCPVGGAKMWVTDKVGLGQINFVSSKNEITGKVTDIKLIDKTCMGYNSIIGILEKYNTTSYTKNDIVYELTVEFKYSEDWWLKDKSKKY